MTPLDPIDAVLDKLTIESAKELGNGYVVYARGMAYVIDAVRAALSSIPEQGVGVTPVVSVKTMKLSDGREDHYVSVMVDGREITPHMFRIKGRAEFEVETWKWLFGQGDEPNIMDWLDRTADPAEALTSHPAAVGPTDEVAPRKTT